MKKMNYTLMGLRGLLALSVVIYHIYISAVIEGYIPEIPKENFLYMINEAGPISVNLFFVISGYLITQSLLNKKSFREFAVNRLLRIYPVFITIHLIIFAVGPVIGYKWMDGIGPGQYVFHFLSNALLLPGMFPLPIAQIVAWSLSYELFFYIIAGLAWLIYRSSKLPGVRKGILYVVVAAAAMIIIYYRRDFSFFAVGVAAYFSQAQIKSHWKPVKAFYFNGVILLAAIYLSYYTLKVPIWAALVLSFLLFIPILMEYGLLSRFLRTSVMRYLGRISFSLYMWHTMVMFPLKIAVPKFAAMIGTNAVSFGIYALLSLALSVLISHLSYHYIEFKFTAYLKSKMEPRSLSRKSQGNVDGSTEST
ncbi:acyltransferase [Paenibacillus vini]|uniref:Acyltransferase n=2 Tax=Paenibacillus vini TaxID=1476024 RepID=A0ABQ4M9I4_9BACL|nr:acyltransferase [Paenibacillus vini]